MSSTVFRKIQVGRESTRGTEVNADHILIGGLSINNRIDRHMPTDERQSLAEFRRIVDVAQGAVLRYQASATYQQILDFLDMGVKGSVEPASATPTGAKYSDNGVFANMTNALDDNTGTEHSFAGFVAAQDKVYVRAAATFRAVKVTMGTTKNAAASSISAVEVSDGASGWVAATLVKDGTKTSAGSGVSLAQTGIIEFTPPSTWASDTVDGDAGFWVRFTWDVDWTVSTDIAELDTVPIVSVWTYTPNLTSRNNQHAYTVEYGDDSQAWVSTFAMLSGFELAISLDDVVMLTADMFSKFATKTTFTAGLSSPTVNEIVSNHLRVYIDGAWANLGSTEKATLVMGGAVRLNPTGIVPVKYADGSLDLSNFLERHRHLELELELAMGANAVTEYDAWAAQTTRAIRLEWTGPTLGGSTQLFRVDVTGKYVAEPTVFDERDGQDIMRLMLRSFEDSSSNEMRFVVQTDRAVT